MSGLLDSENSQSVGFACVEIGKYYTTLDPPRAIKNFEEALSIYESFFGYKNPATTEACICLGRILIQTNRIDYGIVTLEKALIGADILHFPVLEITEVGLLLAKAYQTKKKYELQNLTLSRTFHIIQGQECDENELGWCAYRIENMSGACRFLKGDIQIALQIFKKIVKTELEIVTWWYEQSQDETLHQMSLRHFYYAMTLTSNKNFEDALVEFTAAEMLFGKEGNASFQQVCKEYIEEFKQKGYDGKLKRLESIPVTEEELNGN